MQALVPAEVTALMATGLSVLEASRWCDVSTREAARMMKLAFGESGSPETAGVDQ